MVDNNDDDNVYFIDHNSAAEMARLITQDTYLTKGMGDFFAVPIDVSKKRDVLDLGCGPGGWGQELAFAHREINVIGMDISQPMIEYAQAQAKVQGLDNASFVVGDLLQPLAFPDNSFDIVTSRLIAFLSQDDWPRLLKECKRVVRPGGLIHCTEMEWMTNNEPVSFLHGAFTEALKAAGQSFAPASNRGIIGMTPMLGGLLKGAGFEQVQNVAHVLDISAGAEAFHAIYENWRVFYKMLQPFITSMGVATQEELDEAYNQMLREVPLETFRGLIFMVTTMGQKPVMKI